MCDDVDHVMPVAYRHRCEHLVSCPPYQAGKNQEKHPHLPADLSSCLPFVGLLHVGNDIDNALIEAAIVHLLPS